MTVEVPERGAADSREDPMPPFQYAMFGLRVWSEIRLPLPALSPHDDSPPAWVIRRAAPGRDAPEPDGQLIGQEICATHGPQLRIYRGPAGAHIWHAGAGTFHIAPDARLVEVYAHQTAAERDLGLILVGHVSVYILNRLGYPTLHASGVVLDHGAIAFVGRKGAGKSTMAASFIRRGAALLTDDVLPLRASQDLICAAPGLPLMKLWTEAARRTLELGRELQRLTPELDKGLLALDGLFRFAAEPAPLRALYLLDRGPELSEGVDVAIRPLSKREGLRILLANISSGACLDSAEAERFLAICARVVAQAPVRLVSYAANFARQEAIYEALRSDLAELSK